MNASPQNQYATHHFHCTTCTTRPLRRIVLIRWKMAVFIFHCLWCDAPIEMRKWWAFYYFGQFGRSRPQTLLYARRNTIDSWPNHSSHLLVEKSKRCNCPSVEWVVKSLANDVGQRATVHSISCMCWWSRPLHILQGNLFISSRFLVISCHLAMHSVCNETEPRTKRTKKRQFQIFAYNKISIDNRRWGSVL